jgi:isocitrate dehydrogenase
VTELKGGLQLQAGEVLDASFLSRNALVAFLAEEVRDARERGVLFSLHLKATMMKVSDPILFGHAVRVFFHEVFRRHGETLAGLGLNPNNGLGDLLSRVATLPQEEREAIEADIRTAYEEGPDLAMVDSDRGITNLHVPSDIIIDASMPPMIRDGGRMWNARGELQDCKAVIPDSSYAGIYDAVVRDCQAHGPLDPCHHGERPQRGTHGPEGGGVRLPRQDLRDGRPGDDAHRGRRGRSSWSTGWRRGTSGGPARRRTWPSGTG